MARESTVGRERPGAAALAVVGLGYWLGAIVGSRLTLTPEAVALLWPSTSVFVWALFRFEGRRWPLVAAVGVLAEIASWPRTTRTTSS